MMNASKFLRMGILALGAASALPAYASVSACRNQPPESTPQARELRTQIRGLEAQLQEALNVYVTSTPERRESIRLRETSDRLESAYRQTPPASRRESALRAANTAIEASNAAETRATAAESALMDRFVAAIGNALPRGAMRGPFTLENLAARTVESFRQVLRNASTSGPAGLGISAFNEDAAGISEADMRTAFNSSSAGRLAFKIQGLMQSIPPNQPSRAQNVRGIYGQLLSKVEAYYALTCQFNVHDPMLEAAEAASGAGRSPSVGGAPAAASVGQGPSSQAAVSDLTENRSVPAFLGELFINSLRNGEAGAAH